MKHIILTIIWGMSVLFAQGQTITGESVVAESEVWDYVFEGSLPAEATSTPIWEVVNGTEISTSNQNRNISVRWDTPGTGKISIRYNRLVNDPNCDGTQVIGCVISELLPFPFLEKNVTISSLTAPALSVSSNNCGDKTVSFSETPPALVRWYWQTTANGTLTNNEATGPMTTKGTGAHPLQ